MEDTITLDGRKFHGIRQSLTASQDDYILAYLRLSGAIEVMQDLDGVKRSVESRAEDLLTRILLSGHSAAILSGCLTEEGKEWVRKDAEINAKKFAAITDQNEKIAMQQSLVGFVLGFFQFGGKSSETSQKSSSRSETVPPTKSAAARTSGTSRR
jgi:hypothetical protein